ncbi:MAG: aminotransferase class IV [Lachnospiraceae bacterium]|nr:aminotransferase class IV [Lachnospiraceae bacterium]
MKTVGYYNGTIGEIEDMMVPMNDRAMYFGDGVYDATYAAKRNIFEMEWHLDRFYNSARLLEMPFTMPREELTAEIQKCVDLMDSDGEVMVYWQITRGTGMRNHAFPEDGKPANLLITIREMPLTDLRKPYRVITLEDTRFLHCNIKTLNLIPSVMANQRAKEAGCQEAVFHRGERVTECAHSNVHILKDGVFRTAPTDHLILPGITRKHLLKICEQAGIPYKEEAFRVEDLFTADEIIISSAGTLAVPVCEVDGKLVGGKAPELLHKLQETAVADFERETGYKLDIL